MSACSVGPSAFQPSRSRVSALDADMSFDTKEASQPKCALASSALTDVTGRLKVSPIVSAIARKGIAVRGRPARHRAVRD
ncbi:hypothetical protein QTN93_13455 [Sphingomonas aerolata]|uniref:hypothetical protein n=1 Tax=Sphingomonas aerolata TaxID=185951 RepID=UPI0035A63854